MRLFLSLLMLCSVICAQAQTKIMWHNPMDEMVPNIEGRSWNVETGTQYHRLPQRAKDAVRPAVWNLACHTAGMYVRFQSDSPTIEVRYKITGNAAMPHMPATGVSGVDLYMTNSNGQMTWCMAQKYSIRDSVHYIYSGLTYREPSPGGNEFCLYLPLYNGVRDLEIGVVSDSQFGFIPPSKEKPIVVYGTSIAQGACASRPGMAWSNIVQRKLDIPVVNLGFSGNGLLEESIFRMLAEIDACMFIIDCMPNMIDGQTDKIQERLAGGIEILRQASSVPILLVEHDGYMGGASSEQERQRYEATNKELRIAYETLSRQVPGLYYMTTEEIGLGMDSQVDGIHASDLGMQQYADAYVRKIHTILP